MLEIAAASVKDVKVYRPDRVFAGCNKRTTGNIGRMYEVAIKNGATVLNVRIR